MDDDLHTLTREHHVSLTDVVSADPVLQQLAQPTVVCLRPQEQQQLRMQQSALVGGKASEEGGQGGGGAVWRSGSGEGVGGGERGVGGKGKGSSVKRLKARMLRKVWCVFGGGG